MVRKLTNPVSTQYYRRCVDKIFLMFEHKDQKRYMNSRHHNIQFTSEEESNDKIWIKILDIPITRTNNELVTWLYQKKMFNGIYMNYNSFLPINYKKGLINTFPYFTQRS